MSESTSQTLKRGPYEAHRDAVPYELAQGCEVVHLASDENLEVVEG